MNAAVSSQPLSQQGSNRQYFRETNADGTSIIRVVGTSKIENHAFITMAKHFADLGLPTPHVFEVSDDEMEYTQEDLGSTSLFESIAHGRQTGEFSAEEKKLLEKTIRALAHIQIEGAKGMDWSVCYPVAEFNRRSIYWDLNYWKYCFLKGTEIEFDESRLEDDFDQMANILLAEPKEAFLYRDCQSRNVMIKDGKPYFIDFQGGRKGPVYYDVASLLWQAKANIPESLRKELIASYLDELSQLQEVNKKHFMEILPHFVLFRTLQVLGAYGYRGYFEHKPHFIQSIPFAIRNLRELFAGNSTLRTTYSYIYEISNALPQNEGTIIKADSPLEVTIYSFSYKKGIPQDTSGNGGGYVFDCRSTHNPGKYEQYKSITGLDQPVIDFIEKDGEIFPFLQSVYALVDHHVERYIERGFTHLQICFGCTGGQHRSVYSAEATAKHIHNKYGVKVHLIHREQGIEKEL